MVKQPFKSTDGYEYRPFAGRKKRGMTIDLGWRLFAFKRESAWVY